MFTMVFVIALYIAYRFFIKRCFRCIEFMFCNDKNKQVIGDTEVAIDSNFYNCISFVTLRQELYMVQRNLEIYKRMYQEKEYNEIYLSAAELKRYI